MLDITESMVADFGLPPELRKFFGDGNQSLYFKEAYESVAGAAIKRVVEERPFVIEQVLTSGAEVASWGGYNSALAAYLGEIAAEHGLTALEYFFGLEPGRQSAAEFHGDMTAVLGLLLVRDEPLAHIVKLREVLNGLMGRKLDYGEVWRSKKASEDDWFRKWASSISSHEHLATAIRLDISVEGCLQFMRREQDYLALGLAGVPLSYSVACGPFAHADTEKVRRAWKDGLPIEYVRAMLA